MMTLLFNMLSRFVIAFLPRGKHLLMSWLQPTSAVILEPKKIKSFTASTFSLSICHEVIGLNAMIWVFLMSSFKTAFSLFYFTLIKRLFSSSMLSTIQRLLLFSHSSCLTLCYPIDYSTPGFPVLHYLPEFAQTHVHWVDDAIQPSYPLSPLSPYALSLSQHQHLLQWVGSSPQVAKVLEFQPQSFQWIFRSRLL